MKKNALLSGLLFLVVFLVSGQDVLENNPPRIKWYQVNTPNFRILFPEGFNPQAQRIATLFEKIHKPEARTLGSTPARISVIVQNQSSVSNGFVSYLPRRSELYAMPTQDYNFIGTNEWFDMLVLHEYRHIVQFQHATQGINRLLFYLSGYQSLTGMAHLAVPGWFWEGDAVAAETAFTSSGRGRIPNFNLLLRTNLLEGRAFNYHKAMLGSYKHSIPDEYVLGYHMVSYVRKRSGDPEVWGKVTGQAWRGSIIPFTFSNALKKETGMHVTDLYREMVTDLQLGWKHDIDTLTLTPFERLNPRRTSAYTDYLYPQLTEDGNVIAVKAGIGDIRQLVVLKNGREQKLFVQGIVNDGVMLSAAGGKVVWNEFRFDPRWRVKNHSVIKLLNVRTRQKRQVSATQSRMAGASLSPDAARIATVQTDNQYRHSLLILDAYTGALIREIQDDQNRFYSMPRWSDDGSRIVVLRTGPEGKSVVAIHATTGAVEELVAAGDENIGHPVLHGEFLYYNSPVTGIDNIFALNIVSRKRYQITTSRYGAYNPCLSPDGKIMYYNEQTRDGMDVVRTALNPSLWKPYEKASTHFSDILARTVTSHEGNPQILEDNSAKDFPVTKYSRLKGIINPYAWGLYVDQSDLTRATASISSRDILSTTQVTAGYQYDILEQNGSLYGNVSYQGWYPILDFGFTYGKRETETGVLGRDVLFNWTETGVSGGVRIPLILTRSKYLSELEMGNTVGAVLTSGFASEVRENDQLLFRSTNRFVLANDTLFYVFKNRTDYGSLIYNRFNIRYSHVLKQSHRDFNPAFAQIADFEHSYTPFGGDYTGRQWSARAWLYFPGLLKHHSLYFRAAYQDAYISPDADVYSFRNRIFKPRGYSYPTDTEFSTVSANYELPLWYPDIAIGPLLNIQRVRMNLFYDYGKGRDIDYYIRIDNEGRSIIYFTEETLNYNSFGAELLFDVNFFRLTPEFELGVRASYRQANRVNNSGLNFEVLFGNIAF